MNGFMKVFALTVVAAIAGVEAGFRIQGGADNEAAEAIMKMAVGTGCPDKPEALKIATLDAFFYSLRHPTSLPPWHVFIARQRVSSSPPPSGNLFYAGFCDAIIRGEM